VGKIKAFKKLLRGGEEDVRNLWQESAKSTYKNQVLAVAKLIPILLIYSGKASAEYCRKET
jgi:hypothetical protein